MKFQTILLFAAAASFAFANSLEVSDDEGAVAPNSSTDAGISSEPETGLDEPSIPEGTEDTPSGGDADVASSDNVPSDSTSADVPADSDSTTPGDSDSANPSVDTDSSNPSIDTDAANPDDAGEASDDYGESNPIDSVDGVDAADANGEGSDDYGEGNPAEGTTTNNTVDSLDANDVNGESANAADAGEASADEDDSSMDSAVAAGIAGAAAVSSAGIFLWIKRSKRSELESSPLNMA